MQTLDGDALKQDDAMRLSGDVELRFVHYNELQGLRDFNGRLRELSLRMYFPVFKKSGDGRTFFDPALVKPDGLTGEDFSYYESGRLRATWHECDDSEGMGGWVSFYLSAEEVRTLAKEAA
ncbi:MAG: hypothetical protein HYS81_04305 [Candidatus Aenigmatarchaeota archaeon]|nr:MAG: hypothetical protein HYS81_04305 [Candidatus Aenigmarchaeota archaeon]